MRDVKVRFWLGVSSHPTFAATNGLVFWDFTTGTTDIKRLYNTMGQEDGDAYEYKVGGCYWLKT